MGYLVNFLYPKKKETWKDREIAIVALEYTFISIVIAIVLGLFSFFTYFFDKEFFKKNSCLIGKGALLSGWTIVLLYFVLIFKKINQKTSNKFFIYAICSAPIVIAGIVLFNFHTLFNYIFLSITAFFFYIAYLRKITNKKIKKILENRQHLNTKFGANIFEELKTISDYKLLYERVENIAKIERSQAQNKAEKLSHILYLHLHNNNKSLCELANYKITQGQDKYPYDRSSSFKCVCESFEKINSEVGSFAWHINMINPNTWLKNSDWKNGYVFPILKVASKKHDIDIRRIHILLKRDYGGALDIAKSINTTLFKEQLVGIDNKILLLDDSLIQRVHNNVGLTVAGIYLLDYAVHFSHTNSTGYFELDRKQVLCSDVVPYFYDQEQGHNSEENVKIYVIKEYDSFNLFKENFLTIWYFNDYMSYIGNGHDKKYTEIAKDFFCLIKEGKISTDSVDWDEVAHFLVDISPATSISYSDRVNNMKIELSDKFDTFVRSGNINKEHFHNTFQNLLKSKKSPLPYIY